jgi:hypothetical protein
MNPIEMLKALLPVSLKRGLRALHRDYWLRSSIAEARVRLQRSEPLPEALLKRMIYGGATRDGPQKSTCFRRWSMSAMTRGLPYWNAAPAYRLFCSA